MVLIDGILSSENFFLIHSWNISIRLMATDHLKVKTLCNVRQEESVRMLGLRLIGVLVLAMPSERKGSRLFTGRSAYDQQRSEKLKLAPLFAAIAERLFMFPFSNSVRTTLFDVLMGSFNIKQVHFPFVLLVFRSSSP